ncbi:sulfite exporter TauE/SafE family protein [Clostridium sp.]|uniref:sulfite exporter TauE/SafE family protein n=1 Tax=Clostridium sp. TaxID=1506 RepID=UPI002FC9150D
MNILYFLVAIIATMIGAAAGIGGGVVIKPVLDSVSTFSLSTINLLSSSTIFIMSIVSIVRQLMKKDKIDIKNTTVIAMGSILGGVIGQKILRYLVGLSNNSSWLNILQSVMLIVLLLFVYFYMENKDNLKKFDIKSYTLISIIGIILGAIAAFLGIGGGPMNVALFALLFGMDTKSAARNSIIVIFFSQGAKILSIAVSTGFSSYDLKVLPLMLVGGVAGGLLGYKLNKKVTERSLLKIFNGTLLIVVLINVYNIIKLL